MTPPTESSEILMPTFPARVQESFAAEASSVAAARRFTRRTLESWDADDLVDVASLVVSELVTNAVVHAGTRVRLSLALHGARLRIEVEDRHPGRRMPVVSDRPPGTAEHGRGLMITTSLSSAWGVEYTREAKRVWVQCDRDLPPGADVGGGEVGATGPLVAVVGLSARGEVRSWNADATALFGWPPEEVSGRPWADLVEGGAPDPGPAGRRGGDPWQGTYTVLGRDGGARAVFASHVAVAGGDGTVVLAVPEEQGGLLQRPVPAAPAAATGAPAGAAEAPGFSLREDALVRLGVEEYLALAAERARDAVHADSTYVLLVHDFDEDLEVVATSGLPEGRLGTRVAYGSPGTPDVQRPTLPVLLHDGAGREVPVLAGTGLRSVAVAPVVVEHKLVGALGAAASVAGAFGEQETAVLQRLADSVALAVDRARLQVSERERRGWLSFLADAGDLLASSLDLAMTMAITGQIVVPRLGPWCALHLTDSRGKPTLEQVWHEQEDRIEDLRAALARVTAEDLAGGSPTVAGARATTLALVARRDRIGYLTIGRSPEELLRTELHLVVESVARRAALAIDNALVHGALQAAGHALQESLLPRSLPSLPWLDVGVVYQAAGEDTAAGGDFYDLFAAGHGTWCFMIGDVCGTGAEAAAVTGLARHTVQALVRTGLPLAATLERLNTAIIDEGARSRFLTLLCGTLRPEGSRVRVELVNAGHPPPYLVDPAGGVRELGTPQTLLGVVERVDYVPDTLHLGRGDLLVAVTDGVLERRSGGRMVGEGPFVEHLAGLGQLPAQAVAERIHRLVEGFSEDPQHDDLAVLAIRALAGRADPARPVSPRPR